jgi:tetratricopeptide (TPR) repeat protein
MRGFAVALVAVLAALLLGAPAGAGDLVQKTDGSWLIQKPESDPPTASDLEKSQIQVVREDFDFTYYVFQTVKTQQKIATREIKQVIYERRDSTFDQGMASMEARNYNAALEDFQRAVTSDIPWVPQYALWKVVILQENLGDPDAALASIEDLTKKFPKTKYLIEAYVKAGLIYLVHKNDVNAAEAEFRKIGKIPGVDEGTLQLVEYYLIYIRELKATSKADTQAVQKDYETLAGKAQAKEVATRARLGIGRCLLNLGEFQKALEYFENIVKTETDPLVLAGAYVSIGDCYFKMEKWVDARRAYLRVAVLWDDQPEYHAKALCLAGNCFLLARDTDFRERARAELTRCVQMYPGTVWAKKADDLIATIR